MKIKNGFILREVGGQAVVVAVGEASENFNGIIKLNETGKILWERLSCGATEDELTAEILKEYNVDEATAKPDVSSFVSKMRGAGLLDE